MVELPKGEWKDPPVLARDPKELIDELPRGGDIPDELDPLAEGVLMAHQAEWIADESALKVCAKGRRTGITFAEALDCTLIAAAKRSAGGQNVFYIPDTKPKGREFIGYCAHFAKTVAKEMLTIEDGIFFDQKADGTTQAISSYINGHTCPRALTWRTQRWFAFDRTDGETLLLRDNAGNLPLTPHKFIIHRSKAKSGLTVRSSIARVAVWCWMFKSFTVKDWAIFCQNYGQPIRIGKYGRGATEAEKDVLWRAVSGIAGDCAAIMPREMLVEFHEVASKGTSTDMYERRADWLDRQVSKLVLGQTTTTDAVAGGHAVSQEHRLVQEDIERSDALDGSDTLNMQLVPNMIAFNFGPQDRYPTIHIGRPDEVPLDIFATAFDKLAKHGLTAEASFMRDRLGIPAPKPDAELVGGRMVTPSQQDQPTARQNKKALQAMFDRLFDGTHARQTPDEIVDSLTERLEQDAAGAMSGMIDEVKAVLMSATDLRDAAERLAALDLSADELTEAMARGMALAHLAGQASLLDDIAGRS
jgi:phage gp29-like protein